MAGAGATKLRSLLEAEPLGRWVELLSVAAGLRGGAVVSVAAADVDRWRLGAAAAGLACSVSRWCFEETAVEPGNHTLRRVAWRAGARREISLARTAADADLLASIEDDRELGRWLGYPDCCVERYRDPATRGSWLERLVAHLSPVAQLSAACNRISALMDGKALVPDYFPCSLACEATRELAEINVALLCAAGLRPVAEAIACELGRAIVVTPTACFRLPPHRQGGRPDVLHRAATDGPVPDAIEVRDDHAVVLTDVRGPEIWPFDGQVARLLHFDPVEVGRS